MKFRIITPSLNQAKFIEQCVRSVLTQHLEGITLEYIVMDAVSDDGSQQILLRLADEFPQLKLRIAPDAGQADALLKGFAGSDADVLGWLNADDVLLPGCLARVAAAFTETGADVVYGKAWFMNEQGEMIGAYPVSRFDAEYLKTFCFLSQPSSFFRRSVYLQVGGIDPVLHYCMDYSLWLRIANVQGSFHLLPLYLSATRLHDQTKTDTGGLAFADEVLHMLRKECGQVPRQWLVYRRYRELGADGGRTPAVLMFASALFTEARASGHWVELVMWSAKVYRDHLSAKWAWAKQRLFNGPSLPSRYC